MKIYNIIDGMCIKYYNLLHLFQKLRFQRACSTFLNIINITNRCCPTVRFLLM